MITRIMRSMRIAVETTDCMVKEEYFVEGTEVREAANKEQRKVHTNI